MDSNPIWLPSDTILIAFFTETQNQHIHIDLEFVSLKFEIEIQITVQVFSVLQAEHNNVQGDTYSGMFPHIVYKKTRSNNIRNQ